MQNNYDLHTVKSAAKGHWRDILSGLANVPATSLDGNGHPCPVCDGTDRFNANRKTFDDTGACFCRQCDLSGDGLHVLLKLTGWDFKTAIAKVGDFLHCTPRSQQPSPAKPKPEAKGMTWSGVIKQTAKNIRSRLPKGVTIPDEPDGQWIYRNASGESVGANIRFRRSDGKKEDRPVSNQATGWVCRAMPEPRPLWNLPEVIEAETVYLCEGEKASEAAGTFGIVATASPGGCKAPGKIDWSVLDGKHVVIVPDNDKPGRDYLKRAAEAIRKQAPTAKLFAADLRECWPDIPETGDAFDWSEANDSKPPEWFVEQLKAITKPLPEPTTETPGDLFDCEGDEAERTPAGLRITPASEVVEKPLTWLWQDRFLVGHINIIAGDPGLGKSLTAVDIAARVSAGTKWPDGTPCEQGTVVYSTTEDGYADTVKPRLSAAGANMERVLFMEGYVNVDSTEGPVYLDEHIHYVDDFLEVTPGVRLLVLDTLQSFVGQRTNTNNNASSRRVMTPLKRLAEKHNIAVLAIEHLTKATSTKNENATYRIQGSIAFTGSARSVWIVAKDKADPQLRYIQASKTNLAPDSQGLGLSYTVTGPTGRPYIDWRATDIDTPIGHLLAIDEQADDEDNQSEFDRACAFLRQNLTERTLQKELQAGWQSEMITYATVRRAKEALGIISEKDGKTWYWVPSEEMREAQIDEVATLFDDEN